MTSARTALAALLLSALLLPAPGCRTPGPKVVRLVNAGFELPLDSGWTQDVVNDSYTRGYIERSDTLGQPVPGFAVRVFKLHRQYASLSQTAPLETLGQVCRFWARFRLGGNVACQPVACVAFDYLDSLGNRLGRTLFYLPTEYNPWTDSDTLHLIRVSDTTGRWLQYSLNLQAELDSGLYRVDQARVRSLRVELLARVETSG